MAKMEFAGNTRTLPRWLADFHDRDIVSPFPAKLDATAFTNFLGINITLTGNAAIDATALTVTAIAPPAPGIVPIRSIGSVAIKTGALLDFGAKKIARVTADVKYGDTSIAVSALGVALVIGDTVRFDPYGNVYIPGGILVGRTYASRAANGSFVPITDDGSSFDEVGLTVYDVIDLRRNNDVELLRPRAGTTIKENYLPQWDAYNADPGIADPTVAETLTVAGTDGSFAVDTYNGAYTWVTLGGETKRSPLTAIAVGSTNHIVFASRAFPAGAIARKFYVGADANSTDVQYQGQQLTAGAYNALTPGTGVRPPASNTTQAALGRQLTAIRKYYNTILGVN